MQENLPGPDRAERNYSLIFRHTSFLNTPHHFEIARITFGGLAMTLVSRFYGKANMDFATLFQYAFDKVIETFSNNWFLLLLSILASAAIKAYVDDAAVSRFLRRNTKNSVLLSTGVAVATPLCSCGTTAIVLGMMASTIPWAPIVAFLVASPLTSPQELFYSAGLFGWKFAMAFFAASIMLGLAGGSIAGLADSRGWLLNQARMTPSASPSFSLAFASGPAPLGLPVLAPVAAPSKRSITLQIFFREAFDVSKKLLPLFIGFTFLGYLLNGLIPAEWITRLFGSGNAYSVPLAATLGLPFYISTEASLPLVRAMLDGGMSQGAALAFLITGAGTSLGAIGGALTIARWRVIAIVIGTLWVGSIVVGILYNAFLA
jgi:hypothetical protein